MKATNTFGAFFIALVITTLWTLFNRYEYVGFNIFLFDRINIFPFVMWTIGLTLLYVLHSRYKKRHSLLFITILYLISIGILEAFGYYVLNIRLNSNYPSLFQLGIIHAPVHMKIFYIVAGPLYIIITDFLLRKSSLTKTVLHRARALSRISYR